MKKYVGTKIKALVILASLATLVACGGGNDSHHEDGPLNPYGISGCGNCAGMNPTEFLLLTSKGGNYSMAGTTFSMRLITDVNVMQQIIASGSSPLSYPYPITVGVNAGPAITTMPGGMNVPAAWYSGACIIPAGNYALNTVQAAEMYMGVVAGYGRPMLRFEAIGPTRILFGLQRGIVNGSRLYMELFVLEGPGVAGNQIACQDPYPFTTN
jgi:hypothetical protein